ncbi:Bacterial extracellular solute-binding proteins, family 3 [Roseovarius gaetbuli]|uniref:Bacterial extracellular solute-binding proteins, family 3 n=2 Tax=Roseovarius gaetbuli TaxID=1356575 RepID=A0A1X6ZQ99_9RHOB|nr:Bacterial extracellular solute-binding proteins, family 3 [Roseovarius gaetbuli]
MAKAVPAQGYAIHWVEDWASHLDPLLSNALLDAGFPWYRPDCAAQPDECRCENFLFSDAIFEILILLFTDKARPLAFDADDDLIGKRLCRPAGSFAHDLDRSGRRWLSEAKITLEQPRSVAQCFDLLIQGRVDAVAINEFTGRTALKELTLKDQVESVQTRPLSIQGLHVVVHKSHPQGEAIIALFNQGLAGIKADGTYQHIPLKNSPDRSKGQDQQNIVPLKRHSGSTVCQLACDENSVPSFRGDFGVAEFFNRISRSWKAT